MPCVNLKMELLVLALLVMVRFILRLRSLLTRLLSTPCQVVFRKFHRYWNRALEQILFRWSRR